MAILNVYQVTFHNNLGTAGTQAGDTCFVAAAVGSSASGVSPLITSNYKAPVDPSQRVNIELGFQDSRAIVIDSLLPLYTGVISAGNSGLCSLYRATWRRATHNAANTQVNSDLVVASAKTSAESIASVIQTNNNDGKAVTVDSFSVVLLVVIQ
jgi:hypothetical protein